MSMVSNIICKTAGIAGMSAVLYDAYSVGSKQSYRTAQNVTADKYENIIAAQRTSSSESSVTNAMQNKVANLRMDNPLINFYGRVKGFVEGSLDSLGSNIIPVVCSSLAILMKGFFSKLGALGLACVAAFILLKEGFGVGKTSPIDKG